MKKPSKDLARIAGAMAAAVTEALQHEHKYPAHIGKALRASLEAFDDLDDAEQPKAPETPETPPAGDGK